MKGPCFILKHVENDITPFVDPMKIYNLKE